MAISRRLRFEILRRDGHTCRYCGAMAPDVPMTVDHVIPTTLGGSDEPNNLVAACQDCNAGKSSIAPDSELVEDVDATALRFKAAIERAAELRRLDLQAESAICDRFLAEWNRWTHGALVDGEEVRVHFDLPHNWQESVMRFVNNGLDPDEFGRMVDTAMGAYRVKDEFRYFCGMATNIITDLQEQARRLVENGEI